MQFHDFGDPCTHATPSLAVDLVDPILCLSLRRFPTHGYDALAHTRTFISKTTYARLCVLPRKLIPNATYTALNVMPWITADTASERGDVCLLGLLVKRMDRQRRRARAIAVRSSTTSRYPLRLVYSHKAMDRASAHGYVHILRWWLNEFVRQDADGGGSLLYTDAAMDQASANGHLDVLDWWLKESGLELKYSHRAMDDASCSDDRIPALWWWFHQQGRVQLKYSSQAILNAATHGSTGVLNWWQLDSGSCLLLHLTPAERHAVLMSATRHGNIDVLWWWKEQGLPLLPMEKTISLDRPSALGFVDILDWWRFESGVEWEETVSYTYLAMNQASRNGHRQALDWWKNRSGMPLKYSVAVFETQSKDWWEESGLGREGASF